VFRIDSGEESLNAWECNFRYTLRSPGVLACSNVLGSLSRFARTVPARLRMVPKVDSFAFKGVCENKRHLLGKGELMPFGALRKAGRASQYEDGTVLARKLAPMHGISSASCFTSEKDYILYCILSKIFVKSHYQFYWCGTTPTLF